MRYRLMASYHGSPFEAGIGPTDGDIVLFAACPPPEDLGFEPATGHWRKQLSFPDVQGVWESRPVGTFRGERCMVLDDLGDRLHIGYLGHDGYKAEQLGYWQVDRGVFELIAPRTEVSDIVEERTEYTRRQGPAPRDSGGEAAPAAGGAQASYRQPAQAGYQPDGPDYSWPSGPDGTPSGPYGAPAKTSPPAPPPAAPLLPAPLPSPAASYRPVPDDATGVALPVPAEAPLPLEAQALRAASAARRTAQPDAQLLPAPPAAPQMPPAAWPAASPAQPQSPPQGNTPADRELRPGRAGRRRMATERLFADLASLAGIPSDSYCVGEEVDDALCLIETETGFEVFHSAAGSRHELQVFATEEAACFYLFGVLAAEAVRTGVLTRVPTARFA